jgi:hypothetical protein
MRQRQAVTVLDRMHLWPASVRTTESRGQTKILLTIWHLVWRNRFVTVNSAAERVNGELMDNHGGRTVRVRGPQEAMCHLMFGILGFTVQQLLRFAT